MYEGKRGHLDSIQLLWHTGYWDGPIAGVASIDGYKVYFQQYDERFIKYYEPSCDEPHLNEFDDEPGEWTDVIRDYYAYDIPDEVMKFLEHDQAVWERHVGNNNRYANNRRVFLTEAYKNGDGDHKSYEAERIRVDVSPYLIFRNRIGYFNSDTIRSNRK